MEPPQLPKGPDGTKCISAKGKRATKMETVSIDTVQEGRQCDGIDQRDRRKEKAEGTIRK